MTAEGRLARGKANCETNKFLDNKETLDYIASRTTVNVPVPLDKNALNNLKPKEEKHGKSKSR